MKKVLFLIPTLGGGGAERVLVNLVNNLDSSQYTITLQTIFKPGVNASLLHRNIAFIPGKLKQFRGNTKLMKLFSPKFLFSLIVKQKYDIIVSYLEGPTARIVSGCQDKDTKLVAWIHTDLSHGATTKSFKSKKEAEACYNRFDHIACVAQKVKEALIDTYNISRPISVIYNTNEDDVIREKANERLTDIHFSSETNLISVGRLTHVKGFDRLIRVHKRLLDEGIAHHLYIVGAGEEEQKLRCQIKEEKLADSVSLVGFKANPYKYISNADLFVCSSYNEGFSTVVTESLILGIPVVSTDVSGAKELLGMNNEYGIVTKNSDEGLFLGLHKILQNPSLLNQYKVKANERGKSFSKQHTTQSVIDLFNSLYI